MLPPELADFAFQPETRVTDEDLAARVVAELSGRRVLLFGCLRLGLLEALVAAGLDLVVVDSSRRALLRTEEALAAAGRPGGATLLAQDPRELEIPDGADAIVVPSVTWRAIVIPGDRADILRAFAQTLRPGGALILDLERVAAPGEDGVTEVSCGGCPPVPVSAASPEQLLDEVRGAGFVLRRVDPVGAAAPGPAPCLFAVAGRGP